VEERRGHAAGVDPGKSSWSATGGRGDQGNSAILCVLVLPGVGAIDAAEALFQRA
jgi:hypothetical protein